MRIVTGEHVFTTFSFSPFIPDKNLIKGDAVKSSAIGNVLQFVSTAPLCQAHWYFLVCYIRDGMDILNT